MRFLLTLSILLALTALPTEPNTIKGEDTVEWEESRRESSDKHRWRRGVSELVGALRCGSGCSPLALRGHGCFCGLSGAGRAVDPADRCCQLHDLCYSRAEDSLCLPLLSYIAHYDWFCFKGRPLCLDSQRSSSQSACRRELCECDRALSLCLSHAPCPARRALCRSDTLRLFRQLLIL